MDWISANDDDISITLSSSVAAADWINPTQTSDADFLQHVMLASRTSCHWDGNVYTQAGNHLYSHVLTSSKTGSIEGSRIAKQFNEPVKVVVNPEKSVNSSLAESISFFNIDKDNVIVTTIKKAEEGKGIVARMYDAEGEESIVNLNSFFKMGSLQQTNIIEENAKAVDAIEINPFAIETYRFEVKK
jgi:alpha-mannosidase